MTVTLALQDHCRRDAFIAHSLRVRPMIRTLVVDFVREVLEWYAVLAFLVRLVLLLALFLDLR